MELLFFGGAGKGLDAGGTTLDDGGDVVELTCAITTSIQFGHFGHVGFARKQKTAAPLRRQRVNLVSQEGRTITIITTVTFFGSCDAGDYRDGDSPLFYLARTCIQWTAKRLTTQPRSSAISSAKTYLCDAPFLQQLQNL